MKHIFHAFTFLLISSALALPAYGTPSITQVNCPGGNCPLIGRSVSLPDIDALGSDPGGREIFRNTKLDQCVRYSDSQLSIKEFNFYNKIENFYTYVSTATGFNAKFPTQNFTFSTTFESTAGRDLDLHKDVMSLALDIRWVVGKLDVIENSECWHSNNLTDNFKEAFGDLPPISSPTSSADWQPYVTFLRNWGSHVAVQREFGSRFQQWESALHEDVKENKWLRIKACADVEGVNPDNPGWSVGACAGYTKDEKKESHTKEISSRHKIVGGTAETRADLLKGITEDRINAFIDGAGQADEPIRTIWRPIWEMMAEFTQPECGSGNEAACTNYQRALNLEAAYHAWLALSCQRETARGEVYQEMRILEDSELASSGLQLYGCWARREGCLHNDDCHIGGAGSVCYCYGEGCIAANEKTGLNYIQFEKDDKSYNEGANTSCKYHVPVHCECDGDFRGEPDRYLWMQARD